MCSHLTRCTNHVSKVVNLSLFIACNYRTHAAPPPIKKLSMLHTKQNITAEKCALWVKKKHHNQFKVGSVQSSMVWAANGNQSHCNFIVKGQLLGLQSKLPLQISVTISVTMVTISLNHTFSIPLPLPPSPSFSLSLSLYKDFIMLSYCMAQINWSSLAL